MARLAQSIRRFVWKLLDPGVVIAALGDRAYSGGISRGLDQTEYLKSYRGWVYACVSLIAKNVAKMPLRVYGTVKGAATELEDHPLAALLDTINPIHSRFEFWELTVTWLELLGNAYWYVVRNAMGVPVELWPVPPDRMLVIPGKQKLIDGYLYRYQGHSVSFDADEIVHLRYVNPRSLYYGAGPLQAAAYEYDTELYLKKYRVHLFENDGTPRGVLYTDQLLDEATIERMRAAWSKAYGGVDNRGKVAVLQAGVKYQQIQLGPAELDFLKSSRATRDDILGIFGVPASKLGLVEDVNRANAEANNYTFQNEVILPRLRLIEEKLNKELAAFYSDGVWVEFDSPVPEDREFRLKERETNIKTGYTSINEERERDGLPPASWGELPYLPFNLMQVGSSRDQAQGKSVGKRKAKITLPDDVKERHWAKFLSVHSPASRGLEKDVAKVFGEERQIILANLSRAMRAAKADTAIVDFVLFGYEEERQKLEAVLSKHYSGLLEKAVKLALEQVAAGDFEYDFLNPRVTGFLKQKAFKISGEQTQETLDLLRDELIEGLEANESLEQLADRVMKVFDFSERYRARRIAWTETTSVTNWGIEDAWRQTGLVKKKMWLTARDEKVRESHQALDGEVVEMDSGFTTSDGTVLRRPGDPDGPPGEVINCRCTILPVMEE